MITRLAVKGFKNLTDVDLWLSPFCCIAGPNGAGKSNLFDAIHFLSSLADKPFIESARSVRGGDDPSALFSDITNGRMSFHVEIIIPEEGIDDFGQPATASATFLEYTLVLGLASDQAVPSGQRISLINEDLTYIRKGDIQKRLGFSADKRWIQSVIKSTKRTKKFISTEPDDKRGSIITLSADRMMGEGKSQRGGGKPSSFSADLLPRTVLSSAQNADEHRTAVLVRQEMRTWRQLQLEPSSLRGTDELDAPDRIDAHGGHIPATLWRMKHTKGSEDIEIEIANTLASLVDGVRGIRVEKDDNRRVLRFLMSDSTGLELPASSLSDGTMRFVALTLFEKDPQEVGVICLEEPENGIHPQRMNAMLDLLYNISCDPQIPVDRDNTLRQVLISTHSPIVFGHSDSEDVVFAIRRKTHVEGNAPIMSVDFVGLEGSWRHRLAQKKFVTLSEVNSYLKGTSLVAPAIDHQRTVLSSFGKQHELPFNIGESSDV